MADLLRTERLTKLFRGLVANKEISWSIDAGEIRCIIGPNGAGKTTFISMISGHERPTAGRIVYDGTDITGWPVFRIARMGILRKFQTPTVFQHLSVFENVELAVLSTPLPPRERIPRIMRTLDQVRLRELADELVVTLSHGQRQWLEIGMLLASDARLLLLDEPTAGMTAEETHSTAELLRRLVRELGLSAVIIEHDISFIRDLEAPVMVLHLGQILAQGSFSEIERNPDVRAVYLGDV
ncbi:MAG TPA: ATP-binding cassette domain-containing protein [Hyphomicrobiaceae bacterium]|nr:ATP-binding cassette domain-containing protein [Hyphomicrobiaceae bacterium]